jgi:dolichol-phosphate mannosyltransferase
MKKISVIIPVFYNEENIPHTYKALLAEMNKLEKDYKYEIIFVDDGSGDQSFQELLKVYEHNPENVKIIKLSRNFGQVAAIQAGFSLSSGDAIIVMSADLQDPPEMIHKFIYEWEINKHEIVLAIRTDRDDSFLSQFFSKIFYSLIKKFALKNLPRGGFDYFLISKKILDIIIKMNEKNSFLQGQILWTGYNPKLIPYKRAKRELGISRWTTSKKIKYFIDGLMTFSYFPIRFISVSGIFISLFGFAYAILILILKLTKNIPIKGWAPLMIVILVLYGFQMLMLGMIGEYLWRNYDESRKRPIFIIDRIIEKEKDH